MPSARIFAVYSHSILLPIRSARTFDSGAQTSEEPRQIILESLRAAPAPVSSPYLERALAPAVCNSDRIFQWEGNLKDMLFLGGTSCFFVFKSRGFVLCCLLFLLFICGLQVN